MLSSIFSIIFITLCYSLYSVCLIISQFTILLREWRYYNALFFPFKLIFIWILVFLIIKITSIQIDFFLSSIRFKILYMGKTSLILTQVIINFHYEAKVFLIESVNSRTLYIIAMLLHALFVYIFIFFSLYTIFMSTNTVMFTYLTIIYEIISNFWWWWIKNYILAPSPYLEDLNDRCDNYEDYSRGDKQKLIKSD